MRYVFPCELAHPVLEGPRTYTRQIEDRMRKEKYEAARKLGPIAMQLDEEIMRLGQPEGDGLRRYLEILRTLRSDAEAVQSLERLRLERVVAPSVSRWDRYLNLPHYLWRATKMAGRLGLGAHAGRSIVDIGSGPCFLGYVAEKIYGMDTLGLDLPEQSGDIAWRIARALRQGLMAHCIEPYKPLPDLGRRFNVATITAPQFYRKAGGFWTADEWGDLFEQIFGRYLEPGGEVVLRINAKKRGTQADEVYDHLDVVEAVERVPGSRSENWIFWLPHPEH